MPLRQKSFYQACLLTIAFRLFQKSLQPEDVTDEVLEIGDEESEFNHIRCPLCQWQPDASSVWMCDDCDYPEYFYNSCGTVWNTFNTRGLCPGCGHQWHWTSCLRCWEWSLHEEWYAKGVGDSHRG